MQNYDGLALADSIAGDAQNLLNMRSKQGFFFSRHHAISKTVCEAHDLEYFSKDVISSIALSTHKAVGTSLTIHTLPIYLALLAHGSKGYEGMLKQQIRLARSVGDFILTSEEFELLPEIEGLGKDERLGCIHVIVSFTAKEEDLNRALLSLIEKEAIQYLTPVRWNAKLAFTMVVPSWGIEAEQDLVKFRKLLSAAVSIWKADITYMG